MLLRWEAGEPIFGFPSHPVPWLYVVGDRSQRETLNTITSLGINPSRIPLLPAFAPLLTTSAVLDEAEKRNAQLLVWEGFGNFCTDGNNSHTVHRWLSGMTEILQRNRHKQDRDTPLTILGVVEQPKMKPADIYKNPRQRVSGAAAWGHCSSTIFMIEPWEEDCTGPLRKLGIYPRNAADREFQATLEDGHFAILREVIKSRKSFRNEPPK